MIGSINSTNLWLENQIYIIAEIGINHGGQVNTATNLIAAAAGAGCHAIKFQYRNLSGIYGAENLEIGDEVLRTEIQKNYLSPSEIIQLVFFAKQLGLEVGISFFDDLDVSDFGAEIRQFDFFKIPSVEITNLSLINCLIKTKKLVLISTGAHIESEIEASFNRLPKSGWIPLHCISNYPLLSVNSKLGYLTYLHEKWGKIVGYSSHDQNWENILIAMTLGARIIERHITLDKNGSGLDHSSSSSPEEFIKIVNYANNFNQIMTGNTERQTNQGEIMNLQNLGKGFYLNKDMKTGEILEQNDLHYRHPRVGISKKDFNEFCFLPLKMDIKKNSPLVVSHFLPLKPATDEQMQKCNDLKIALPIRLHDYIKIQDKFKLDRFELHLSFGEIESLNQFKPLSLNHKFSIHLPDYIDSTTLMNPFSNDSGIANESIKIIEAVISFAILLNPDPIKALNITGSFTQVDTTIENFYRDFAKLQSEYTNNQINLLIQWLPPFAWYFGGSEKLEVMNKMSDVEVLLNNKIAICMDSSHILLGAKYWNFNPIIVLKKLQPLIKHVHLSDAKGFDGEGYPIGKGDPENLGFLKKITFLPVTKVIEVWQGHLNEFSGFNEELKTIGALKND